MVLNRPVVTLRAPLFGASPSDRARRARADTPALPASPMNDVIVIGLGLALYAFMVVKGHLWLIGVAPFG
jgi:hypothetical protein